LNEISSSNRKLTMSKQQYIKMKHSINEWSAKMIKFTPKAISYKKNIRTLSNLFGRIWWRSDYFLPEKNSCSISLWNIKRKDIWPFIRFIAEYILYLNLISSKKWNVSALK
jgi:hypothetical protein